MTAIDTVAAYRDCRERTTALIESAGDSVTTMVPACPAWSVHDVAAHLAGVCTDIVDGRLDGVGSEAWTDAHVQARRDRPTSAVLAEWSETGPKVEALFPADAAGQLCFDAATHEQDIRSALGRAGGRDAPALRAGVAWAIGAFGSSLAGHGCPALRIVVDGEEHVIGEGEPSGALRGSAYDVFRALTGRRSEAQLAAMDWDGEPATWLPAFAYGPFSIPTDDVPE
jgi:uncharacterized protein (TIGR03083 family)